MTIIDRARACVATRPAAKWGQGGNPTTFGVAALLVWGFGLSPAEALGPMLEYNERCDPPWSQPELVRMLENALRKGGDKPRGYLVGGGNHERGEAMEIAEDKPKVRRKAVFSLEALKEIQDPRLPQTMALWRKYLAMRSPVRPDQVTAEMFLDGLYEPGEKVLVFNTLRSQGDYCRIIGDSTWKLDQTPDGKRERVESLPAGSPEGMNFFMQPVTGGWRRAYKSIKMTRRSPQCVTRWPYILLESDHAPHELWLNALVRLRLRVVAIIASGGRSLHAVVKLDKETEAQLRAEIDNPDHVETLVTIGCDPQALKPLVYPRLPNTWRDGKRMGVKGPDGKAVRDRQGKPVMKFFPFPHGRAMQGLIYYQPAAMMGRSITEGVTFEHRGE